MAARPGKLLTHRWLLNHVWGPGYEGEAHYLRVFVRQLRRKLDDDSTDPRWIGTEPGIGYRWLAESGPSSG
jgi:two-component system KDP operon response regulator KdpE